MNITATVALGVSSLVLAARAYIFKSSVSEVSKEKVFKVFINLLFPDPHNECGPTPPPHKDQGPPNEALELYREMYVDHYVNAPK